MQTKRIEIKQVPIYIYDLNKSTVLEKKFKILSFFKLLIIFFFTIKWQEQSNIVNWKGNFLVLNKFKEGIKSDMKYKIAQFFIISKGDITHDHEFICMRVFQKYIFIKRFNLKNY